MTTNSPSAQFDRAGTRLMAGDGGVTLVETLVSMIILTLFLALFSTNLLTLVRSVRRQTSQIDAQQSSRTAFQLMDKQIRYADAITSPGPGSSGTDQWIEWRVPSSAIPAADSASQSRCYQWRASSTSGLLQFRTWVIPTSGSVTVPAWIPVASDLVIGSTAVFTTSSAGLAAAPFSLPASGSQYARAVAKVGVSLTIQDGSPAGRSAMSTVFTAMNSSPTPSTACSEVPRS